MNVVVSLSSNSGKWISIEVCRMQDEDVGLELILEMTLSAISAFFMKGKLGGIKVWVHTLKEEDGESVEHWFTKRVYWH